MAIWSLPLQEARRLGGSDVEEAVTELEESVHLQSCLAEAMQLRQISKQMLEKETSNEEGLEVNTVWRCLDILKEAVVTAQQGEAVESEAHTLCCIADVYDTCLPWAKQRAKEYYGRAFQLCQTLYPKTCTTEGWYQNMVLKMQAYQKAVADADDAEAAKEREPILRENKKELDAIKKAFNGAEGGSVKIGIEHIYATHAPKPGYKAPDVTPDTMKEALRSAIMDSHPDKNMTKGLVWRVMCEEIVKILNDKYALFKV